MSTPFRIIISPDGRAIDTVYGDPLKSMGRLGPAQIWRATEVSFDNKKGCWQVQGRGPLFRGEPILATTFPTHKQAIAWEIAYLNEHLSYLQRVLDTAEGRRRQKIPNNVKRCNQSGEEANLRRP